MKAKDIEVGRIYAVEKWKGGFIPFRVDRVEKSPVRRGGIGHKRWGGDIRAYGIELRPESLTPLNGTTLDFALAKVVGLWDGDAWAASQAARANQDEVDRRDRELGGRLCNALADRNVGASYDGRGLLIARPTLEVLAKVLGIEVPE